MECTLCGRPISSLDKDGICSECRENAETANGLDSQRIRHSLTSNEFEVLLAELDKLANE